MCLKCVRLVKDTYEDARTHVKTSIRAKGKNTCQDQCRSYGQEHMSRPVYELRARTHVKTSVRVTGKITCQDQCTSYGQEHMSRPVYELQARTRLEWDYIKDPH